MAAISEVIVDGEELAALWRALRVLGVDPGSSDGVACWFHAPSYEAGLPVEVRRTSEALGVDVVLDRVWGPDRALVPSRGLRVRFEAPAGQDAHCRALGERLLRAYETERRADCRSAEHFLGQPKDFAWHESAFPRVFLASLHALILEELAGWECIKVARSRSSQKMTKLMVLDRDGQPVAAYLDARFFYRRESSWLVLELAAPRPAWVTMSLAASGVQEGFELELLSRLDKRLTSGGALGSRKMLPTGEELELDRTYHWSELFIEERTKVILMEEISSFFGREAAYRKMGIPHRRGLLFHGPPGTGKTLVGKILASNLKDCVFMWITAAHIADAHGIQAVFALARASRRSVLFFEDLDLYASRRAHARDGSVLGELLVQLDGLHGNHGTMVIATTNDLDAIEPALRERPSRFDLIIPFGHPSKALRRAHLLHLLAPYGVTQEMLENVVERSDGLTGAQLQELAVRARFSAARRDDVVTAEDLLVGLEDARRFRAKPVGFQSDHDDDFDE